MNWKHEEVWLTLFSFRAAKSCFQFTLLSIPAENCTLSYTPYRQHVCQQITTRWDNEIYSVQSWWKKAVDLQPRATVPCTALLRFRQTATVLTVISAQIKSRLMLRREAAIIDSVTRRKLLSQRARRDNNISANVACAKHQVCLLGHCSRLWTPEYYARLDYAA